MAHILLLSEDTMKYKKRIAKLEARIADYKKTISNLEPTAASGFHKPGSKNK